MSETKDNEMVVPEAIDDCGLRFLLAARHHIYLMNTLPMRQRAQLQQQGLSPAYYIWAFHSESQQARIHWVASILPFIKCFVNFLPSKVLSISYHQKSNKFLIFKSLVHFLSSKVMSISYLQSLVNF